MYFSDKSHNQLKKIYHKNFFISKDDCIEFNINYKNFIEIMGNNQFFRPPLRDAKLPALRPHLQPPNQVKAGD
jgi:hypothetical protein